MTLTGVGYGDITPANFGEMAVATVLMVVGCAAFARMIGNVCNAASSFSAHSAAFHTAMDRCG
jgi:hypothetical protein